jgi:hypothetical protein
MMTLRLRGREGSIAALFALFLLLLAAVFGLRGSVRPILLLAGAGMGALLLARPVLGPALLLVTALVWPLSIRTGTEVTLNLSSLLVPALLAVWGVTLLARRRLRVAPSRANRPLLLFLLAGLLSLGLGNVLWDPAVPKAQRFILVQLAQWAIFAFSAGAFWLGANLVCSEAWLRRLTWSFLYIGGGLAVLRQVPGISGIVSSLTTIAFVRAPFWVLLAGLAGGQVLFNRVLSSWQRLYLWLCLGVVAHYAFFSQREAVSNWVGVAAVFGVLAWLRFPRLRWPAVALLTTLVLIGILFPAVYGFAGGDDEWILSGGSRLVLIERVVSVTLRNPLTGLGPASYRNYANAEPLLYRGAFWLAPRVSSHNNYVDIFAHTGLLGLALFLWALAEIGRLGWRLAQRIQDGGFLQGYAVGMTAALAAAMAIMMLADWMLPFVYNIGFPGFQAALPVWLFLGGLAAIQNLPEATP